MRRAHTLAMFATFAFTSALGALASVVFAISLTQAPQDTGCVEIGWIRREGVPEWPAQVPVSEDWPVPRVVDERPSFGQLVLRADAVDDSYRVTHQMTVTRLGWPSPVLERIEVGFTTKTMLRTLSTQHDYGFAMLWLNLAVQSLSVGALGALTVGGALALNARCISARVRRGECVACRHPLAGLRKCPECGTDIPQAR